MVGNIINRGGTELSAEALDLLLTGIADLRSSTHIPGGKPLLRLLKSGVWVFGQGDEPVQIGSKWAVNPLSIQHGWCCWSDSPDPRVKNELLGELMAPIMHRKPLMPEAKNGVPWKEQRAFEVMCVLGEDEGVETTYKTNSIGGMRAVDNLLAALVGQLRVDPGHPVPVVQLKSVPYDHNKFGQIFNPIFDVVGWATMTGEQAAAPLPKTGPAPVAAAAAPARPAKAPIGEAVQAAPARAAAPARPAKAPIVEEPAEEDEEMEMAEAAAAPAPPPARPGAAPRRQRPEGRA